jgi:hypothetical protein
MKKLLFAVFFVICYIAQMTAQTNPTPTPNQPAKQPTFEIRMPTPAQKNQFEDDMMQNAPIVFHGRIIGGKPIGNTYLFSKLVVVSHTYRGNIQPDTVEVIFTGDAYFREVNGVIVVGGTSHGQKYMDSNIRVESIFFCKPSEQPKKHRQSKAVLDVYATHTYGYSIAQGVGENGGAISSGIRKTYYPNAKPPYLRNEEFWYKLYNQPNIRLLPRHKGTYSSSTEKNELKTPTLTIAQSAETLTTSGNNSFVEFDILVSGSEYLRLFNAQLQYDTFAIKPNLTIGTDLIVTKGTAFGSIYNIPSTWVKPPTGTRTINLQVSSNGQSGSTGWTTMTTTPQVLLHVKIKLKPNACTGGNLVTFNTTYTDTQKCLYYTSSGTMYGSNALAYATTYPNNKTLTNTPCGGLIPTSACPRS